MILLAQGACFQKLPDDNSGISHREDLIPIYSNLAQAWTDAGDLTNWRFLPKNPVCKRTIGVLLPHLNHEGGLASQTLGITVI
jgi:hypothetical protein